MKALKKNHYILMAIAGISLGIFLILSCVNLLNSTNTGNTGNTPKDTTAPVLSLLGEEQCKIRLGDSYVDEGITAIDDVDGDISSLVVISGTVDTATIGTYLLTYTAIDSSNNISTISRTVEVSLFQTEEQMANPPGKVVYLTFDDGPTKYTEQLLNILDKYNVKATFFVTNQFSSYQNMIGEAYRRGHTIAMHTYSHRFQDIYTSESAYYNDLNRIRAICEAQTGVTPKIVRFPGGTSNTVSKKYCSGIMTRLSQSLGQNGYLFCDWNVDSDDAGNTTTKEGVATNVIAGIQKKDCPIVLQHDTYIYSIEAVEEIICWGLTNGCTFLPMSEDTPMLHQPVNN